MDNAEVLDLLKVIKSKVEIPDYMELEEVVNYSKISRSTIIRWRDQIGYFQKDRKMIFKRSDVDAFIASNTIKRVM